MTPHDLHKSDISQLDISHVEHSGFYEMFDFERKIISYLVWESETNKFGISLLLLMSEPTKKSCILKRFIYSTTHFIKDFFTKNFIKSISLIAN